jgi:hypothetical protein
VRATLTKPTSSRAKPLNGTAIDGSSGKGAPARGCGIERFQVEWTRFTVDNAPETKTRADFCVSGNGSSLKRLDRRLDRTWPRASPPPLSEEYIRTFVFTLTLGNSGHR